MAETKLALTPKQRDCKHEWDTFKQTVSPNNPNYLGHGAHFVVRGCTKCKRKTYIDYVVDRI